MLKRIARHVREYDWFAVVVEVAVIIIGLMLAFQLDRWREERVERREERTYVTRLDNDIEIDSPAIEYAIEIQTLRLDLIDLLIEVANEPEAALARPTEFLGAVSQAAYTYTPTLTSHTFENLRSTGDLGLVLDEDLKQSLFDYYGYDEGQRQFRPLQFVTESRHFALAAGILSNEQEMMIQDRWLFFRPYNIDAVREFEPDPDAVAAAANRLRQRPEFIAWLPYIRSMQLEQIAVHGDRLNKARSVLLALEDYAEKLATNEGG